jgi:hypothetical protein
MLIIPDWMIMLILVLVILVLMLLLLFNKYKKRINYLFRREVPEAREAQEITGPAGPEEELGGGAAAPEEEARAAEAARAAAEKQKIQKVLNLLEKEYNEGIISEKAYNELTKRNLEKLKKLGG